MYIYYIIFFNIRSGGGIAKKYFNEIINEHSN
jgi:hypothetical protein